ncbi:MAG: hypothetical protein ACRYFS_02045 [Janthinobacterium lividum]
MSLTVMLIFVAAASIAQGTKYPDGRPSATLRMDARDQGIVLKHGGGPGQCDIRGARDLWVFQQRGTYYIHYDGAGPKGWLVCLATSHDLVNWTKKGPVLDFGKPGEADSASASYGTTYFDGTLWHMFYLGTPNTSPAPDFIPAFPYQTMEAQSLLPMGPWGKHPEFVPFQCVPNTDYSVTASPGQIIRQGKEYLIFFSAASQDQQGTHRTISIARTVNLNSPWSIDPQPILPPAEQIENSSLYFEKSNHYWFLFTNHIGLEQGDYTDAIWVYWTKDLNHWNASSKAVVLDGSNCKWSRKCIGLPGVIKSSGKLAVLYDAPGDDSESHLA